MGVFSVKGPSSAKAVTSFHFEELGLHKGLGKKKNDGRRLKLVLGALHAEVQPGCGWNLCHIPAMLTGIQQETKRTLKTIFRACRACFEAQNRIACTSGSHFTGGKKCTFSVHASLSVFLNVIITIVCRLLTAQSDLLSPCAGQNDADGEDEKIRG